jgi:hypothetical protein
MARANGYGPVVRTSTSPGRSIPCAVVVDSRNVRGQSRKTFGHSRETEVSGIGAALYDYGLTPVEVQVGIATRTSTKSPSGRLQDAIGRNVRYRDRMTKKGARVLEGHLVERKGELEEKQVDVLCAIAVADIADRIGTHSCQAQCIVVLSEDMDLIPAYEFATARGVPVVRAA